MASPGIIVATKFVQPTDQLFNNYVDYIDREEAVRNNAFKEFTCFDEYVGMYMDNREKTYGLFTVSHDFLSNEEKQELKKIYYNAQKKGSLMWQTVISFDNKFLQEQGMYDYVTGAIDETKLREYTRKTMSVLLQKENFTDAVWSASVHKNTDNIHVHIATVQPSPCWKAGKGRCRETKHGKLYQRGKFKQGSIDAAKSCFANEVARGRVDNEKINMLIRDRLLIYAKKFSFYSQDEEISAEFITLAKALPDDLRLLKYGNNAMKPHRKDIDHLTMGMIEKYFAKDYEELKNVLAEADDAYVSIYGESNRKFSENHLEDLRKRAGNIVLQQVIEYKKEMRKEFTHSEAVHYETAQENVKKEIIEQQEIKEEYASRRHVAEIRKSIRIALGKTHDNLKNQAAYRRLMQGTERT